MLALRQPEISLELETTDRFLDIVLFLLLAVIAVVTIIGFALLPVEIPVKYDGNHNVISYGSKLVLLINPIMALVLGFALRWLRNYPHIFNYPYKITEQNIVAQYRLAQRLIMEINIVETMIFAYLAIAGFVSARNLHSVTDMRITGGMVLLLFVVIFIYLRRAKALR